MPPQHRSTNDAAAFSAYAVTTSRDGATHAGGGTLDHVMIFGLVAAHVTCSSIPPLFSDRRHMTAMFRSHKLN